MRLISPVTLVLVASLLSACATPPDLSALEAAVTTHQARVPARLATTPFGQAVLAAVTASPTLGRSEAALREAEAGLIAAGGTFRPEILVGLRPDDSAGFGVTSFSSLSMLLYDGGAGEARKTAARARVLGGYAGRTDAGARAALAAVNTWAEVVTARVLLRASQETLAALEATTARIKARVAAGAGASGEVLMARSRLANERAAAVSARAEVTRAETVFAEVFGHRPGLGMALPPLPPQAPSEGATGSPILMQAEAAVLAAEADHAAARAGRAPTLAVSVSVLAGGEPVAGLATEQILTPMRGSRARFAATEARIAARRADLDATRRELESRLRILAEERRANDQRLAAAREASEANRAILAISRDQFETGRQTLVALLDAEREALAAERKRILAEHERAIFGYAALAATGDILDLFGIELGTEEPAPRAE